MKIWNIVRHIDKYLGTVILFLLVLLVITQVTMRTVFSVPLIGPEELARYFLICIVFFSMSYTARNGGHIRMEELQSFFPKKVRRFLQVLVSITGIVIFGLFAVASIITTTKNQGNVTPTLAIPFTIFFLPTMVGFTLLTVEYIIRLIKLLQGHDTLHTEGEPPKAT